MKSECLTSLDPDDRSCVCKFFFPDGEELLITLQKIDHYHQLVRLMKVITSAEVDHVVEDLKFRMKRTIDEYYV